MPDNSQLLLVAMLISRTAGSILLRARDRLQNPAAIPERSSWRQAAIHTCRGRIRFPPPCGRMFAGFLQQQAVTGSAGNSRCPLVFMHEVLVVLARIKPSSDSLKPFWLSDLP